MPVSIFHRSCFRSRLRGEFHQRTCWCRGPQAPIKPQGTVEIIRPGLFAGYVERFGPYFTISADAGMIAT